MSHEDMIDSTAAFSRNVATLLRVTGLKKARLAELCDMPAPRISEILGGRYAMNLKTVDRICNGFNRHFGEEIILPSAMVSSDFEIPARIFAEVA